MMMHRRDFLKCTGKITLASIAAFNFGCTVKPMVDQSDRIALIYGTRYGATEDTANWIAEGIGGRVDVINIEVLDFDKAAKYYDKLIIGSGIWIDGAHQRLMELLKMKKKELEHKIIASFIVCGTTGEDEAGRARIETYFERFHKPLAVKPALKVHFGGRMIIEKLSEKDRKLLDNFYRKVLKREFASWDRTDPDKAKQFGVELRV